MTKGSKEGLLDDVEPEEAPGRIHISGNYGSTSADSQGQGNNVNETVADEARARISSRGNSVRFWKGQTTSETTSLVDDHGATVAFFGGPRTSATVSRQKRAYTSVSALELFHKIVFICLTANFILFAQSYLQCLPERAIVVYFAFSVCCWITCATSVLFMEAFFSQFIAILVGYIVYFVGTLLLTLLSVYMSTEGVLRFWSILALYLICLGESIAKTLITEFGKVQFSGTGLDSSLECYIHGIYWSGHVLSVVIIATILAVQQYANFEYSFGICAILLFTGFIAFVGNYQSYNRVQSHRANPIRLLCGIIREAKIVSSTYGTYQQRENIPMSSEEEQVHMPNSWLDYAMVQYGGTYSESDVLEVRALSKVTLMFAMFIPYWVIYAQCHSTFYYQGLYLDTRIGNVQVPVAWMSLFGIVFVLILVPVLDRCVYPSLERRQKNFPVMWRVVFGMFAATLAVIIAAGVEVKGTSAGLSGKTFQQTIGKNEYKAVEVSIFWQIPQYILLAISEVFTGLTGLNLAYKLCSGSFQRLVTSLYYLVAGIGNLIALIIIITGWFPDTSYFASRTMEVYFFSLGGMMAIGTLVFALIIYNMVDQAPIQTRSASPEINT